jgi:hypothetical protein
MNHAISPPPGAVVLDWRHAQVGEIPEPCAVCGQPALCRSPRTGRPCHKRCAENWITGHAADPAQRAELIRAFTPRDRA